MGSDRRPTGETETMWLTARNGRPVNGGKRRKADPGRIERFLEENGYDEFSLDGRTPVDEYGDPLELGESTIDEMARELDLVSGKWAVFFEEEAADDAWQKIRELVDAGEIMSAKVSTRGQVERLDRDRYVACVYTPDYTDEEDVMQVRELLREEGFEEEIPYKPDIYTALGVYLDNAGDFGLDGTSIYRA